MVHNHRRVEPGTNFTDNEVTSSTANSKFKFQIQVQKLSLSSSLTNLSCVGVVGPFNFGSPEFFYRWPFLFTFPLIYLDDVFHGFFLFFSFSAGGGRRRFIGISNRERRDGASRRHPSSFPCSRCRFAGGRSLDEDLSGSFASLTADTVGLYWVALEQGYYVGGTRLMQLLISAIRVDNDMMFSGLATNVSIRVLSIIPWCCV